MAWPKLLANLVVMGGAVVGRAFAQAYRHVINDMKAAKSARPPPPPPQQPQSGAQQAAAQAARIVRRAVVRPEEARQILNVREDAPWADVEKSYEKLFKANDPAQGGSFYLQSKVHRSKECLEQLYRDQGRLVAPPAAEDAPPSDNREDKKG